MFNTYIFPVRRDGGDGVKD